MKKVRTFYLGYDIKTAYLINSDERFELVGVALISELLELNTFNIFDSIFRFLYKCKIKNKHLIFQPFLVFILHIFRKLLSNLYSKYADYLFFLIKNNVKVVRENNIQKDWNIDVFIVNNWWKLSSSILLIPHYGCINIHPSILPMYRGSLPTLWSLKNGDNYSAVSFILLDSKIDAGPIISQYKFKIMKQDNSIDLEYKIEEIVSKYLLNDIIKYVNGLVIPYAQSEEHISFTDKYYNYMQIRFNVESSVEIRNKVKLYPYLFPIDLCYFFLGKRKIYIRNCSISSKNIGSDITKIIGLNLYIKCIDGKLIVIKLFKDINIVESLYIIFH